MEEVAQQQEITRLAVGPNASQIVLSDAFIEQNKHRIPVHVLLTLIKQSEGLRFTDPITHHDYTIIDAWVQDDDISVVVRGRAL